MNEWARIVVALWLVLACFHPALAQDANRAAKAGVVKITAQRSGAAAEVGSGFVIRLEKGVAYVLTAAHVVESRRAVQVQFFQGSPQGLPATVVGLEGGKNPQGLALLKVEGSIPGEVRALPLDSKVELEGGEAVVAIRRRALPGLSPVAPSQAGLVAICGCRFQCTRAIRVGR